MGARRHPVWFAVGLSVGLAAACGGAPAKKCSPSTCAGCCDETGACLAGTALLECGAGGASCQRCEANQVCEEGSCALFQDGDYDASFPDLADASVDPDAGVFHPGDAGRGDGGRPDAGPSDAGGPVSFAADVAPIFATHCNTCHSWNTTADLVNAVATRSACSGNIIVVPGDPSMGVLYGKISAAPPCGGSMPNGQPPLITTNPAEVDTIRRWILQGARNN